MSTTDHHASTITIRPADADDQSALARLAALDSAAVPPTPMLLAEVDGALRAAFSLRDGSSVADPFFPTRDLVGLLRAHGAAPARTRANAGGRRRYRLSLA